LSVFSLGEQAVERFKLARRLQRQNFAGRRIQGQEADGKILYLAGLIESMLMSEGQNPFADDLTKANRGSDNSKTGWIAASLMAVLLIGVLLLWSSALGRLRRIESLRSKLDDVGASLRNALAESQRDKGRIAALQTQVARQEIDRTLKAFRVGELTSGIDGRKHHHYTFSVLFAKEPDIFPVLINFKEPLHIKCDGKKGIRLKIHERLRPPDRIGMYDRNEYHLLQNLLIIYGTTRNLLQQVEDRIPRCSCYIQGSLGSLRCAMHGNFSQGFRSRIPIRTEGNHRLHLSKLSGRQYIFHS